jgi:hypothetical protein
MDRPDIKYLIESAKIPYDKCDVVEDVEFESSALLGMDAPRASFEYLLNLGVDTVVCEGAAGYLPIWQGAPPVTHIFFIDGYGHINYFHNINLEIIFDQDRPMQSFEVLTNIINGRSLGFVRSPLYLAREEKIDAVSESMVLDIFRHLKLL